MAWSNNNALGSMLCFSQWRFTDGQKVKQTNFEICPSSPKPSCLIPISLAGLILNFLPLLMVFKNDTQASVLT
jgi:hypothetical protein